MKKLLLLILLLLCFSTPAHAKSMFIVGDSIIASMRPWMAMYGLAGMTISPGWWCAYGTTATNPCRGVDYVSIADDGTPDCVPYNSLCEPGAWSSGAPRTGIMRLGHYYDGHSQNAEVNCEATYVNSGHTLAAQDPYIDYTADYIMIETGINDAYVGAITVAAEPPPYNPCPAYLTVDKMVEDYDDFIEHLHTTHGYAYNKIIMLFMHPGKHFNPSEAIYSNGDPTSETYSVSSTVEQSSSKNPIRHIFHDQLLALIQPKGVIIVDIWQHAVDWEAANPGTDFISTYSDASENIHPWGGTGYVNSKNYYLAVFKPLVEAAINAAR